MPLQGVLLSGDKIGITNPYAKRGLRMNADDDVMAIRKLIDDWSAAVRRRDYDGTLENRSADILMFDVPPPFQSEGVDA